MIVDDIVLSDAKTNYSPLYQKHKCYRRNNPQTAIGDKVSCIRCQRQRHIESFVRPTATKFQV